MEKKMNAEEATFAIFSEIQKLPEDCVSQSISLTCPRDACRSEAVSSAFRSMAASDIVWKSFLPSDYAEILARAVDRVDFDSLKQLYFRLCDTIIIDGGKMGFFVDRETGIKSFILPARELSISWGDTPQYWRWINHPESRFVEVAELVFVCWLEIHGRINSRMLSKRSNYHAYLIFKVTDNATGFMHPLLELSVTVGTHVSKSSVRLTEQQNFPRFQHRFQHLMRLRRNFLRRTNSPDEPHEDLPEAQQGDLSVEADEAWHDRRLNPLAPAAHDPSQMDSEMVGKVQIRSDGWMELLLGEFYNEEGDDGEVVMSLLEIKDLNGKSGLIVEGIEIRPNKK